LAAWPAAAQRPWLARCGEVLVDEVVAEFAGRVDLAELGPQLFDRSSPGVQEAVDGIRSCSLVVVASPIYKASYTGLLKSFLDWFGNTSLEGVTVIPVMTGAGASHASDCAISNSSNRTSMIHLYRDSVLGLVIG